MHRPYLTTALLLIRHDGVVAKVAGPSPPPPSPPQLRISTFEHHPASLPPCPRLKGFLMAVVELLG